VRATFALVVVLVAALGGSLTSCATTGAAGEGDRDLPTVGVGPFRKLGVTEVPGIAPFVLDDRVRLYRDPAVLADGDATLLYAVATVAGPAGCDDPAGCDVIVRSRALDGRAFFGTTGDIGHVPPVVLRADQPWEMPPPGAPPSTPFSGIAGPFALRVEGEIFLYYGAAGGIGLARSSDGLVFRKEPGPVLARDPSSWERSAPRAPTVYRLPGGSFRLLYAAGTDATSALASGAALGEAESDDGIHFRRLDADPSTPAVDPVLAPSPSPSSPPAIIPGDLPPFDDLAVDDPCALVRTTPAGRLHVLVLYTGASRAGGSTVGFAARYGDRGPLVRQASPVYAVGARERAPALLQRPGESFLYVQQDRRVDARLTYPAIAAAYAPGARTLAAPLDYPDTP